jgi:hypothetical protein
VQHVKEALVKHTSHLFAILVAGALLSQAASAATTPATSFSYQLVAPLTPMTGGGSGTFTATLTPNGSSGQLSWKLLYTGLRGPVLSVHLRIGNAASIRLCRSCPSGSGGSFTAKIGAGSPLLKAILGNDAYATIDTKSNRLGQLRGRLRAKRIAAAGSTPAKAGVATLAPAITGGASGTAQLSWDPDQSALTVTVDLSGLATNANYTEQVTPGCTAATGHIYKLDDFTSNGQGAAHVVSQVPDVPALDLSGAWSIKIGNPGTSQTIQPGSGGGGGGGGGQPAAAQSAQGQVACGQVTAPGAAPGTTAPLAQPITVWQKGTGPVNSAAQAAKLALAVVSKRGWTSLTLDEVHIFPDWFEVETNDSDGLKGPEIYVNNKTGNIGPEQGPNNGWDTVYGHGQCTTDLSAADARQIAQNALATDQTTGAAAASETLGDSEQHHGYWEFELQRQGKVVNQMNVNNCTQGTVFEDGWQPDMLGVYAPNG